MSHTEADYYESINIPPWERFTLTIPEAAEYLVFVGNKILFKRKLFEDFLSDASCI